MPELTMSSPYVHSKVDSTTFTMGNPWPESTLTPCQSRPYPPSQALWIWPQVVTSAIVEKMYWKKHRLFLASNYNRNVHLPNLSQTFFSLWNRQSLPMQADKTGGVERATRHRVPYFFLFLFQSFTPLKADEVRPQLQNKLIKSLSAVNFHEMASI